MKTTHSTLIPLLTLENVAIEYASQTVLSKVGFTVAKGEIACLLGPSGSGKTSLLRAIAGFINVGAGTITIKQQLVSSTNVQIEPSERSIGLVFQDFALFPHLTVSQNVAFGLQKLSESERSERVLKYLSLLAIAELANKYPAELSGGQQQRVAIARALAPQPDLLLMDEAFSNLDPTLRQQVTEDIRELIKNLGITALLVTHDQQEAFAFADKIAVLAEGKLQQYSSAFDLYHEPSSFFVAKFVGEGMFIQGHVVIDGNTSLVECALGQLSVDSKKLDNGDKVQILLRPDDIIHDDASSTKAIVVSRQFRGAYIRYLLQLEQTKEQVLCLAPSHHNHDIGESFGINASVEHVICFK